MEDKNASLGIRATQETASWQAAAAIAAMPDAALTQFRCPLCGRLFLSYTELVGHYTADHPDSIMPTIVTLQINGRKCELLMEPQWTLKQALQFKLGLTGAKHMCDRGACGSCTVIMDGRPVLSCQMLAAECEGANIQTVEGIASDPKWKPLVDAYCKWEAMQCGYCTPGFLVTAKALLDRNPNPTPEEIKTALSGNICICGTYPRHSQAILEAVEVMAREAAEKGDQ